MPIHDWTRVDAGLFHAFHQTWVIQITDALNRGILPPDYYALPEQRIQGPIPNVLTLRTSSTPEAALDPKATAALATADVPVKTKIVQRRDAAIYGHKATRISVRHRHGDIVAVIEIVSPGNKASRQEFRSFVENVDDLLRAGIHLLVVDLFPPVSRDPDGIHAALWDEHFSSSAEKPLTAASYDALDGAAYVEPLAVGDALPDMPIFLRAQHYVLLPLEATYQSSWEIFPDALKGLLT